MKPISAIILMSFLAGVSAHANSDLALFHAKSQEGQCDQSNAKKRLYRTVMDAPLFSKGDMYSHRVGILKQGDIFVAGDAKNGWVRVKHNGKDAYIGYVQVHCMFSGTVDEEPTEEYYSTVMRAPIFSKPDMNSSRVDVLNPNVFIAGKVKDGWVKFKHNGKDAYISYLQVAPTEKSRSTAISKSSASDDTDTDADGAN